MAQKLKLMKRMRQRVSVGENEDKLERRLSDWWSCSWWWWWLTRAALDNTVSTRTVESLCLGHLGSAGTSDAQWPCAAVADDDAPRSTRRRLVNLAATTTQRSSALCCLDQ